MEDYRKTLYPASQYEDFKKIINAYSDFNKVVLCWKKTEQGKSNSIMFQFKQVI